MDLLQGELARLRRAELLEEAEEVRRANAARSRHRRRGPTLTVRVTSRLHAVLGQASAVVTRRHVVHR